MFSYDGFIGVGAATATEEGEGGGSVTERMGVLKKGVGGCGEYERESLKLNYL